MRTLKLTLIAVVSLGVMTQSVLAEPSDTVLGRYLTTATEPLPAQIDLLSQSFDVHFPRDVVTVGSAIKYLLNNSGYQMIDTHTLDPASIQMLLLPLPDIDRDLGPMTLLQGLQTLAGQTFQVVVDPVHRLIAFRLKAEYQNQYGGVA
jgi:conjugative transfer region protein (TIGR03748 family)